MLFAILRGIIAGAGVTSTFVLIVSAVVYLDNAGTKIPPLFAGVFLPTAFVCSIGAAIAGYASHPSAKGPPAFVRRLTVRLILRWIPRFIVRTAIGTLIGFSVLWPIFLFALIVGSTLGIVHQWQGEKLAGHTGLDYLWFFMTIGCCCGTLSGAIFGSLFAPVHAKAGSLVRMSFLRALAGAVVGGWLDSTIGMMLFTLRDWAGHRMEFSFARDQDVLTYTAWYTGIGAGLITAIFLWWRRRNAVRIHDGNRLRANASAPCTTTSSPSAAGTMS